MSEIENLERNPHFGKAPGQWLTLKIHLGEDSDVEKKILGVMRQWIVATEPDRPHHLRIDDFPSGKSVDAVPGDLGAYLKSLLPDWFIESFEGHSRQEMRENENLWDYDSWVYAMENRVWSWWGHSRNDSMLVVQLQLDSWPYSIGPLRYLAWVAGGNLVSVEE